MDQSLTLSLTHLADRGMYLSKHTHPLPPTVNPWKQTAVDPEELEGVCQYLDAELSNDYVTWVADSFVISPIHKYGSRFAKPQARVTINKLTMSTDLAT